MPDFMPPSGADQSSATSTQDKWAQARAEVELGRQKKNPAGEQEGGKSLYEVLQANKAAKQEAFEESIKLKNQFRSLDDDEIDFLDSVLESTRAKEAAVREETTEQLDLFRRQRDEAEKAALLEQGSQSPELETQQWTAGKGKRKRRREPEAFKGLKLRKSSSSAADLLPPALHESKDLAEVSIATMEKGAVTAADTANSAASDSVEVEAKSVPEAQPEAQPEGPSKPTSPSLPGLGLAGYSSDED